MTRELNKFDSVRVKFAPKRTDDLKPEMAWWIGRTFMALPHFIVDEGAYAGQWALMPDYEEQRAAGKNACGWIPECDLEFLDEDSTSAVKP